VSLIHIAPMPIPELGSVVLRVDASGDQVDRVVLQRQIIATGVVEPVPVPAAASGGDDTLLLVGNSVTIVDTTCPLDTPVRYLAAPYGSSPIAASATVTLVAAGTWWLGDPLRPDLDVAVVLLPAGGCPTPGDATIVMSLGERSHTAGSKLVAVDDRAGMTHVARPMGLATYPISFATRTDADRVRMTTLLAPGGVLRLRAPEAYGYGAQDISVVQATEARLSADHRSKWRVFTLTAQQVEPIGGQAYGPAGTRTVDACAAYATYTAAAAAGVSWSAAAYGPLGATMPAAVRTCAEGAAAARTCATETARGLTCYQRTRDGS